MEQKIDSVLAEPLLKKGRFTLRTADFILLLAVTAVAFLARFGLFSHVSGDYTSFLSNWFDTLKNAGGLAGIGMNIGDYTPPYLYILALLTYLPVEALISIKLVSCIFDFLLALYAAKTVFHLTQSRAKTLLAYTRMLISPDERYSSFPPSYFTSSRQSSSIPSASAGISSLPDSTVIFLPGTMHLAR